MYKGRIKRILKKSILNFLDRVEQSLPGQIEFVHTSTWYLRDDSIFRKVALLPIAGVAYGLGGLVFLLAQQNSAAPLVNGQIFTLVGLPLTFCVISAACVLDYADFKSTAKANGEKLSAFFAEVRERLRYPDEVSDEPIKLSFEQNRSNAGYSSSVRFHFQFEQSRDEPSKLSAQMQVFQNGQR